MIKNKELTIRTRNITSGRYFEAAYFNMTLAEAKVHALADHPNSEVVGVWPHAFTPAGLLVVSHYAATT